MSKRNHQYFWEGFLGGIFTLGIMLLNCYITDDLFYGLLSTLVFPFCFGIAILLLGSIGINLKETIIYLIALIFCLLFIEACSLGFIMNSKDDFYHPLYMNLVFISILGIIIDCCFAYNLKNKSKNR